VLRAVIFDFDGVIADDERLHLAGFRHALAAHGIELSERTYFERYLGYDDREGFEAILRDHGKDPDRTTLERLMREKARVFQELVRERVRIFPGVRPLLEDLKRGDPPLPTAIGSGALRSEVELVLGIAGLRRYFDVLVCADDVERGKPDPQTFTEAMARLRALAPGLQPGECLVVEDSTAGIEAARAAGMQVVAVANSYPPERLAADLVVTSLEELNRERCRALFPRSDRSEDRSEGTHGRS